ncbi:MAG: cysteine synthase A [Bacteroidales bacterium]|nr:MAG: cysteine synthase A [Bacteroidales bacterium]
MKANNVLETIGNTPHIRVNKLFPTDREVWVKFEKANPGGSIKDRIALAMIEDAERNGILKPGMVIVEPTSGNTGVGLAMVAAVKGYKMILVMPESFSVERRKLMSVYGATFVLTPREGGMKAALDKAVEIVQGDKNAWMPSQFDNPANVDIHRKTTAQEIINDFPDGIDYLISGVGTGGHISGVAEILKSKFPKLKVFAVEPELSPIISGGKPGPHPLQGIGPNFIPGNLNMKILDGVITINKDEAYDYTRRAALDEGLLVGISSGASLAAIAKKIPEIPVGSKVLTFAYDTGERYFSVDGLF